MKRSVLVVDDSPSIRRRICEICDTYDFEVCAEAINGVDAIEKAAKLRPELVILDLSMPVMGGLEAAPHLKKILPSTPIIIFTLFGETLPPAVAQRAGISMVVSKTDPLESLIDKARALVLKQGDGSSVPKTEESWQKQE